VEKLASHGILEYISFSMPGKSWKLSVCHGESWKKKYIIQNSVYSTVAFLMNEKA